MNNSKHSFSPNTYSIQTLFEKLWPICRSITGNGIRESFKILNEVIPLELTEVPTGTKVHDWTVPKEWNVKEAYIKDPNGKVFCEMKTNNLHLLNYSSPIKKKMKLSELLPNLYSKPEMPEAIPYITSYYKERWGFCLTENEKSNLPEGEYEVFIDSELKDGSLTYGELLLEATVETKDEILLSSYLCHPSMANNELSGPICLAFLYKALSQLKERRFNYRFYIGPETIGAITFLSRRGKELQNNCIGGFVLTCCGDDKRFTYKKTRRDNHDIDKLTIHELELHCKQNNHDLKVYDFFPQGSDERQFSSPGYNLPIGSIMRTMYGEYKEYHTSLDNKEFISFKAFAETVEVYMKVLTAFEANQKYTNQVMYGEPQLGKRNLYPDLGTSDCSRAKDQYLRLQSFILNYSDGNHDLLDIAQKAGCSILDLIPIVRKLTEAGLIKESL